MITILRRTGKLSEVLGPLGWTSGKEYYPVPTAQIDISSTLEMSQRMNKGR